MILLYFIWDQMLQYILQYMGPNFYSIWDQIFTLYGTKFLHSLLRTVDYTLIQQQQGHTVLLVLCVVLPVFLVIRRLSTYSLNLNNIT